jgi:peptidyl-prolyl cis-trans isomerase C
MRVLVIAPSGLLVLSLVLLFAACKPVKPSHGDESKEARARVSAAALQKEDQQRASGAEATSQSSQEEGKSLTSAERSLVVAKIGDYELTLGDMELQIKQQPAFARARYRLFEKKVEFLNNLVQFELLAMEAHKKGYDTDPAVVLAAKRAMVQKFINSDLSKAVTVSTIADEEIARYYENNKSLFKKPEQVRVSHILLDDAADAAAVHAAIKQAIDSDRPRARVIFSEFTRRKSKDRSTAFINGDLNFFARDGYPLDGAFKGTRLPAPLVDAAFKLTHIGSISPIVKSDQGHHILQISNRRPAVDRSLERAKRQITNTLLRRKKEDARASYIQGLKDNATVEIYADVLKQLKITGGLEKTLLPSIKRPTGAPPGALPAGMPRVRDLVHPSRQGARLPKEAIQKQRVPRDVGPNSDARPPLGTRP